MARTDREIAPAVKLTPPATPAKIHPALIALAAFFALIVLAQGITAPFQKDAEPQSAEWIRSIVRDHRWLIPQDAYGAIDRKPPLFYWLSATVAKAGGNVVDEARARTVSLIAGVVLAVLVLTWTAANVGIVEAWLAFLFLLGTYGFASRATTALTDMLLTALLFGAYCVLYPLLREPADSGATVEAGESSRRAIMLGVLLGAGILTKGPIAIVLCALAALTYLIIERRNPVPLLRARWPWIALTIAIAIGACWYVPAVTSGKERVLRIIFAENFGHFMPAKLGGTGESYRPFYFIAARLLGGAFPMTLLIVPAIIALARGDVAPEKRSAIIYQASMPIAVLVFFSIASVKRDDYILPALPGIAILCASLFSLKERRLAARLRDVIVAGFTIGCAIVICVGFVIARSRPDLYVGGHLQSSDAAFAAIIAQGLASAEMPFVAVALAMLSAAVIALWSMRSNSGLGTGLALAIAGLAGSLLWTATLRPELAKMRSLKYFAPRVAAVARSAAVCIPAGINYELSFYYDDAIPALKNGHCPTADGDHRVYLVASPRELDAMSHKDLARLKPVLKSVLIGGGGPPALYELMPEAK
jgi:4-amino-4-deoxy-L-arabinose transferase-like glycosyltransferase